MRLTTLPVEKVWQRPPPLASEQKRALVPVPRMSDEIESLARPKTWEWS